jgi:hypothetical protein
MWCAIYEVVIMWTGFFGVERGFGRDFVNVGYGCVTCVLLMKRKGNFVVQSLTWDIGI